MPDKAYASLTASAYSRLAYGFLALFMVVVLTGVSYLTHKDRESQLAFELQLKRVEQVPLMFPELLPGIRRTLLQATISFSALRSQPLRAAQLKATELKRQPSAQRQRGH